MIDDLPLGRPPTHILHVSQPVDGGTAVVVEQLAAADLDHGRTVTIASPPGRLGEWASGRGVHWVELPLDAPARAGRPVGDRRPPTAAPRRPRGLPPLEQGGCGRPDGPGRHAEGQTTQVRVHPPRLVVVRRGPGRPRVPPVRAAGQSLGRCHRRTVDDGGHRRSHRPPPDGHPPSRADPQRCRHGRILDRRARFGQGTRSPRRLCRPTERAEGAGRPHRGARAPRRSGRDVTADRRRTGRVKTPRPEPGARPGRPGRVCRKHRSPTPLPGSRCRRTPQPLGGLSHSSCSRPWPAGRPALATPAAASGFGTSEGVLGTGGHDPEQLAGPLELLLGDAELRQQLGRAARAFVTEHHAAEITARRHDELVASLLTGTTPTPPEWSGGK